MESFLTFSPKFSQLQSHKWSAIPRPAISETLIPPKKMFPSISSAPTHCYPPPQLCCCNTSSSSSLDYNTDSSTKIFIKGLPRSTSEGHLKNAFSKFGEVGQVKLIMDRESGQSLGVAYIWFSRKESALLAVKEMNGKDVGTNFVVQFFDGRFIYVTVAKPRSYKNWRTMAPYRF